MKGKIVTCINNTHPIYDDYFKNNKIKVGRSYMCIGEVMLTSKIYYKPKFASLEGVTIKSHLGKWGWSKPCLPKECFRVATIGERNIYCILFILNAPLRFIKTNFYKFIRSIRAELG